MKTVTIDCIGIDTAEAFHCALAQALNFPAYYGKNLDSLFDCLTENRTDLELILNNWHALTYKLGDWSGKVLYVFRCACDDNRHLTVTLHP